MAIRIHVLMLKLGIQRAVGFTALSL